MSVSQLCSHAFTAKTSVNVVAKSKILPSCRTELTCRRQIPAIAFAKMQDRWRPAAGLRNKRGWWDPRAAGSSGSGGRHVRRGADLNLSIRVDRPGAGHRANRVWVGRSRSRTPLPRYCNIPPTSSAMRNGSAGRDSACVGIFDALEDPAAKRLFRAAASNRPERNKSPKAVDVRSSDAQDTEVHGHGDADRPVATVGAWLSAPPEDMMGEP